MINFLLSFALGTSQVLKCSLLVFSFSFYKNISIMISPFIYEVLKVFFQFFIGWVFRKLPLYH